MKKYIVFALAALLFLTGCNLDTANGLYDAMQNAEAQDENPIQKYAGSFTADGSVHHVFNTQRGVTIDKDVILGKGYEATVVLDATDEIIIKGSNEDLTGLQFFKYTVAERKLEKLASPIIGGVELSELEYVRTYNYNENFYNTVMKKETAEDGKTVTKFRIVTFNGTEASISDEIEAEQLHMVGRDLYVKNNDSAVFFTVAGDAVNVPKLPEEKKDTVYTAFSKNCYSTSSGRLYIGDKEIKAEDKSFNIYPVRYLEKDGKFYATDAEGIKLIVIDSVHETFGTKDIEKDKKFNVLGLRMEGDALNLITTEDFAKKVDLSF